MTFSGCRAATRLLEGCFILLYFKIYNVFLPINVWPKYYRKYLFYIFKVSKSALSWRTIRLNMEFMGILKQIFFYDFSNRVREVGPN